MCLIHMGSIYFQVVIENRIYNRMVNQTGCFKEKTDIESQ